MAFASVKHEMGVAVGVNAVEVVFAQRVDVATVASFHCLPEVVRDAAEAFAHAAQDVAADVEVHEVEMDDTSVDAMES